MSLANAARQAREHADACADPGCLAAAVALESAVDAAAKEQLAEMAPEPDTSGVPEPPVSRIVIPRPDTLSVVT